MDLLAISRDLVAADTVSHKGTAAAVAVLRPLYERIGLAVTVQERDREGAHQQNLLGTYAGADPASLVLSTHLDTVDPGDAARWTETDNSPLWLTRKGDHLYGLGAADAKLAAVCQLFAAREFQNRPLRRSLQLLGTFGAEQVCDGARFYLRGPERRARFAVVSEPTELQLVRAHRGYAAVGLELVLSDAPELSGPFERRVFRTERPPGGASARSPSALELALGELGGGALVSLEANAASHHEPRLCTVVLPVGPGGPKGLDVSPPDTRDGRATLALAARLYDAWCAFSEALEPRLHSAFGQDPCKVRWTAARVSGPRAELVFEARLLPGQEPEALNAAFAREAERLAESSGARVRLTVLDAKPALELAESAELLEGARAACRDVGLPDGAGTGPSVTEAGFFAEAGIDAFVFGPGRLIDNAHCVNEYNLLSQMEKAIEFYRALITRLCV